MITRMDNAYAYIIIAFLLWITYDLREIKKELHEIRKKIGLE
jgi:hypothetical protein